LRLWFNRPKFSRLLIAKLFVMSDNVYKKIELTGSSDTTIEDAVGNAIAKASKTIHNMRWFEVVETRGSVDSGKVMNWQVTVKLGFTLE